MFESETQHRACGVMTADKQYIGFGPSSDERMSEVILTAGSLGTPAILQRSGIGPKKLLDSLDIPVIVANDEVGHGVDHMEVPVMYEWLNQWNESDGKPPRGGPMAWPLAMFFDISDEKEKGKKRNIMVHFGISPPPYGGNEVTGTPNCRNPDPSYGYRCYIPSVNPREPIRIVHAECKDDFKTLAKGTHKMIEVFEVMKNKGLVGNRVQPPLSLDIHNEKELDGWIRNHLGTAYHWMSTCRAGKDGTTVADENFRVRGVANLRVGSGAALPEIPDANPHLTIAAYSMALAQKVYLSSRTQINEFNDLHRETISAQEKE